jgi:branched-chain amino acid transport system permease protein
MEILKPLGLLFLFVVGSSIVISAIVLLLAFLLQGTRDDMDMMQITLILLPQVLIDGLVLGFMYATIALGYTMVYGVLEFINFAHGEFFMFGAFAGVGLLNWLDSTGALAGASVWLSYIFLFLAILAGMIVAGALSGTTERLAYRPLRGAPRLVPLIAAIGVSFFLQDAMRFYQSAVNGVFYQTFPDFGNFSERITLFQVPYGDRTIDIST